MSPSCHKSLNLAKMLILLSTGDALGIYPENCPDEVNDLICAAHLTGFEPVKVSNQRADQG